MGREKSARRQPEQILSKKRETQFWDKAPIAWPAPRGPHKSNAIGPGKDSFFIFFIFSLCGFVVKLTKKSDETTVEKPHNAANHEQCL